MVENEFRFTVHGLVSPMVEPLVKAVGASRHRPTRPLAGWLAVYGRRGPHGGIVPTQDRDGHVFEAARSLGQIDWSPYLRSGLWNDTHRKWPEGHPKAGQHKAIVGLPVMLEFHDGTTALSKAHGKLGFWTAGHLFDRADPNSWELYTDHKPSPEDLDRADYYWALSDLLKGLPRPLGISCEGKMALDKATRTKILFAIVENAAVCEIPKNADATLEQMEFAVAQGPLEILAKALDTASGGVHSESPGVRAIVPEDLEGDAQGDAQGDTLGRLLELVMERFQVTRETAQRWVKTFLLRSKNHA